MKYMHTYSGEKKRRVLPQEIRVWVRKTYNVELVDGANTNEGKTHGIFYE